MKSVPGDGNVGLEPIFQAPGDPFQQSRRLLLISYHFPPGSTAGSLRWQKLSRFAFQRGWALDVISLHTADLQWVDHGRLDDLPPGTRIFGVHHRLSKLDVLGKRLWKEVRTRSRDPNIRLEAIQAGAFGAPSERTRESVAPEDISFSPLKRSDLRRAFHAWLFSMRGGVWADDAVRLGLGLSKANDYRLVISSGPPHMAHVAGLKLATRMSVPFVMDLRDPWSIPRRIPETYASPVYFRLAERYETRAVWGADLIVANTDAVARAMRKKHVNAPGRVLTVTNGTDEEMPSTSSTRFYVTYAGALYLDRDPRPLFRAAREVIEKNHLLPTDFRIEMVGGVESYGGRKTSELALEEGVGDYTDLCAPEPHQKLMERISRSSVLVSLPQDSPWAIPSKIFEYMQFKAWLLVYAEPGTPTWELLTGSEALLVRPNDIDAGARAIEGCYRRFRKGLEPPRIPAGNDRFRRDYQAAHLFDALEGLEGAAVRRHSRLPLEETGGSRRDEGP